MGMSLLKKISTVLKISPSSLKLISTYLLQPPWVNSIHSKIPIFVVGCQRSGTTMLLNILERSPQCRVYQEGNSRAFFNYRLQGYDIIRRQMHFAKEQILVFKPLNDLQHTDHLLNVHSNAKAIWIFRQYKDVISSAVRKWQSAQKHIVVGIGKETQTHSGQTAVREGISPDVLNLLKALCTDNISSYDGAALLWYVQNSKFFSLNLHEDHRVLLVNYEDLVTNPKEHFERIFDFIGCRFSIHYIHDVYDSSIGNSALIAINPTIASHCEQMMNRLNETYAMRYSKHVRHENDRFPPRIGSA
jgi:hypothetical protein